MKQEQLGQVDMNQCEITYVNHIMTETAWNHPGQVERLVRPWSGLTGGRFLPAPDDVALQVKYIIPGPSGEPAGRLHVALQPALEKSTRSRMHVLTLTARGAPCGEGIDGAFDFLDAGREWIVEGFASITEEEMHKSWGRLDVG